MLFNSMHFFVFFPIVLLIYYIIPKKARYVWLLICSYYFYMCWNAKYALLMATSTIITFFSGLFIEYFSQKDDDKVKKWGMRTTVFLSFFINLGILIVFKYLDWILGNINALFGQDISIPFSLVLPVGISFYTFQALSYTVDVYRKDVTAEKNIFKYALFVSFFPQLVAGPIERSKNLLEQVRDLSVRQLWNGRKVLEGFIIMVWGYFMKLVIADRISLLVDNVFDHYFMHNSVALFLGALGFTIQIYCDFASYSTIAVGAAKIMGFELMENFNTPYFSKSIKEFWRRWHISLSGWFKDYLYIPLGGNRKGKFRTYMNLMITFLVSGLWHGASWHYVIWGGIHGLYQIIGDILSPIKKKILIMGNVNTSAISYRIGQTLLTFFMVMLAWIFFRAETLGDAVKYIIRLFSQFDPWSLFNGNIYTYGLNRFQMNILIFSLVLLFLISLIKKLKNLNLAEFLMTQGFVFRWGTVLFLILFIYVFGMYGEGFDAKQFIYFQF